MGYREGVSSAPQGCPLLLRVALGSSRSRRSAGLSFSEGEDVGVTVVLWQRDIIQGPDNGREHPAGGKGLCAKDSVRTL